MSLNHQPYLCPWFLCSWKDGLPLFKWNFSWGSFLSKLMWHGFSHFPEIVTWGLFTPHIVWSRMQKVKAALVLSSYAYVHRERNSGERVREGQDPSLPQLASCKLDLQMVPCGLSFEKSSISMREAANLLCVEIFKTIFFLRQKLCCVLNNSPHSFTARREKMLLFCRGLPT